MTIIPLTPLKLKRLVARFLRRLGFNQPKSKTRIGKWCCRSGQAETVKAIKARNVR